MKPSRVLGFLAVYNIVQNTLLVRRGYVAGNLAATAVGLVWVRRSGFSAESIGLETAGVSKGLRLGAGVAAAAAGLALVARNSRQLTNITDDRRLVDLADREVWYRLLVRFPLGTALFEEIWFRGVLPATLRHHGFLRPDLVSAAAFTAWHLIPTAAAIDSNEVGRAITPGRKVLAVVGGSVAAGVGGLAFTAMRNASGVSPRRGWLMLPSTVSLSG